MGGVIKEPDTNYGLRMPTSDKRRERPLMLLSSEISLNREWKRKDGEKWLYCQANGKSFKTRVLTDHSSTWLNPREMLFLEGTCGSLLFITHSSFLFNLPGCDVCHYTTVELGGIDRSCGRNFVKPGYTLLIEMFSRERRGDNFRAGRCLTGSD